MKKCTSCKEDKAESEFHFRNKETGTRRSECKTCVAEKHKASYDSGERKQRVRENAAKRKQAMVDLLWAYKQGKVCADCPQTDPRTFHFDHLPEHKKYMDISKMIKDGYSWTRILEEIKKCEIVCASCHSIRTYERGGWVRNITIAL